jgi:hypothetical protein
LKDSNLDVIKLLANIRRIILRRKDYPSGAEQVEFELEFTNSLQSLLTSANAVILKNFSLYLDME